MIQDHVYKYYIAQNRSCAESIFLAADEEYRLGASAQALKAAGAFSGGACCGGKERHRCQVYTGAGRQENRPEGLFFGMREEDGL